MIARTELLFCQSKPIAVSLLSLTLPPSLLKLPIKTLTTRLNLHITSLSLFRFTIYSFFFFRASSKVSPSRKGSTSSAVTLKLRKKNKTICQETQKIVINHHNNILEMSFVLQGKKSIRCCEKSTCKLQAIMRQQYLLFWDFSAKSNESGIAALQSLTAKVGVFPPVEISLE